MKTTFIVFSLFLTQIIDARIGMTLQECRTKYGIEEAKSEKDNTWVFIKNNFYVITKFENAKVVSIGYSKKDKSWFTDAEVTLLLRKNHKDGNDSLWVKVKENCWDSKDGLLVSAQIKDIQMGVPVLTIFNKIWYDKEAVKLKEMNDL